MNLEMTIYNVCIVKILIGTVVIGEFSSTGGACGANPIFLSTDTTWNEKSHPVQFGVSDGVENPSLYSIRWV